MRKRTLFVLLSIGLLALVLTGCWHSRSGQTADSKSRAGQIAPPQKNATVVPASVLVGKVVKVFPAGRFAVLNFPVGRLPEVNQVLVVYRGGLKIGEVRISGPQMDDNIVADVVVGGAEPGDEVRVP